MSKTIEQTASNQIEQIASEQQEIGSNKNDILMFHINEYYKYRIGNIPTPSLYTLLGKYTNHKLMTYKLTNTNHTRMKHTALSVITVGSKISQ